MVIDRQQKDYFEDKNELRTKEQRIVSAKGVTLNKATMNKQEQKQNMHPVTNDKQNMGQNNAFITSNGYESEDKSVGSNKKMIGVDLFEQGSKQQVITKQLFKDTMQLEEKKKTLAQLRELSSPIELERVTQHKEVDNIRKNIHMKSTKNETAIESNEIRNSQLILARNTFNVKESKYNPIQQQDNSSSKSGQYRNQEQQMENQNVYIGKSIAQQKYLQREEATRKQWHTISNEKINPQHSQYFIESGINSNQTMNDKERERINDKERWRINDKERWGIHDKERDIWGINDILQKERKDQIEIARKQQRNQLGMNYLNSVKSQVHATESPFIQIKEQVFKEMEKSPVDLDSHNKIDVVCDVLKNFDSKSHRSTQLLSMKGEDTKARSNIADRYLSSIQTKLALLDVVQSCSSKTSNKIKFQGQNQNENGISYENDSLFSYFNDKDKIIIKKSKQQIKSKDNSGLKTSLLYDPSINVFNSRHHPKQDVKQKEINNAINLKGKDDSRRVDQDQFVVKKVEEIEEMPKNIGLDIILQKGISQGITIRIETVKGLSSEATVQFNIQILKEKNIMKDSNDKLINEDGMTLTSPQNCSGLLIVNDRTNIYLNIEEIKQKYASSLHSIYVLIRMNQIISKQKKEVLFGWIAHSLFRIGEIDEGEFTYPLISPTEKITAPPMSANPKLLQTKTTFSIREWHRNI